VRILLTNDDGIDAPGLAALRRALSDLGEVVTVAPLRAQSATGHAATFHRPLTVDERPDGWAVDGRPADCVRLGLFALFGEHDHSPATPPFDLVVSGMNAGANLGVNVLYSGTVGAAREANLCGLPSIAVSLHLKNWHIDADQWARAATHARMAIDHVLGGPLDARTLMNINVPVLDDGAEPRPGLAVVPASLSAMGVEYERREGGGGRVTYRVTSTMTFLDDLPGTDVEAVFDRRVTLTPLRFDTNCPDALARWRAATGADTRDHVADIGAPSGERPA